MLMLNYSDRRSFYKWCKNYNIGIMADFGSHKKYILSSEFNDAINQQAIKYIMEKHGKAQLLNAFQAHSNVQAELRQAKEEINRRSRLELKMEKPGKHELAFKNRLTKKLELIK